MRSFALLTLALLLSPLAHAEVIPLSKAIADKLVDPQFTGNGHDRASLRLLNLHPKPLSIFLPQASVLQSANQDKQLTLQPLTIHLNGNATADLLIPTLALSSKNTRSQHPLTLSPQSAPHWQPLLNLLAQQPNLPQSTIQLAGLILTENLDWPATRSWSALPSPPSPTEISQTINAIALAQLIAPRRPLQILQNDDLKRLALRNPLTRDKAMRLYGFNIESLPASTPLIPPNLQELLHLSPNDNCPACRARQTVPADIP